MQREPMRIFPAQLLYTFDWIRNTITVVLTAHPNTNIPTPCTKLTHIHTHGEAYMHMQTVTIAKQRPCTYTNRTYNSCENPNKFKFKFQFKLHVYCICFLIQVETHCSLFIHISIFRYLNKINGMFFLNITFSLQKVYIKCHFFQLQNIMISNEFLSNLMKISTNKATFYQ